MLIILLTPFIIALMLCCFSILREYALWHQENAWCKVLEEEEFMNTNNQISIMANEVFNWRYEVFTEEPNGQLTLGFC